MSDSLFPDAPGSSGPQEPCPVHGPGGAQEVMLPVGIQRLSNLGLAFVDANGIVRPTGSFRMLVIALVLVDKVIESIIRVAVCMTIAWVLLQLPFGPRITAVLAPVGHPIAIAATIGFVLSLSTTYVPFTMLASKLQLWYNLTMRER